LRRKGNLDTFDNRYRFFSSRFIN